MLCIRYTDREGCEISGAVSELRTVAEAITHLAATGGSVSIPTSTMTDARPYDRLLHRLVLHVTTGPVCARVAGDQLDLSAGADFLDTLSSFFIFDEGTPVGHHHHHEYWEGNAYVSSESTPLVISVTGTEHPT